MGRCGEWGAGSLEEQQIFKTAGCLIHGELLPLPSFRIAMHHGFLFLFYLFSFLKCPVEDGVQRNSAALENGGKSAPRPILMFIRVSCVFGPDHKQNKNLGLIYQYVQVPFSAFWV